jgi:hypothetical protein
MRNFIEMEIENDSRGSYFVVFFYFRHILFKTSIKLITLLKLLPFQKHLYYLNTTWLCALLNANADKSILVQNSPGYKTLYVSFLYKPLTCCKNFNNVTYLNLMVLYQKHKRHLIF